jgi:hypothetical protein
MDPGYWALLIAIGLAFVVFVLVQHSQRILRHQSGSIKRLLERMRNLESISDPMFLQRLNEAAPMPLEQIFTISFRLDDVFWTRALRASDEVRRFVREYGSFVGSVKLERWRSHTVATIAEIPPDRKATGWQTRSLELYSDPARANDSCTLWEMPLAPAGAGAERPPSLELLLRANTVEFLGHLAPNDGSTEGNGHDGSAFEDVVFFRIPLDTAQLARFRAEDPAANGNGHGEKHELSRLAKSWQTFYLGGDETLGIEWQLRMHDLTKKSEWERWKILESASIPEARQVQ